MGKFYKFLNGREGIICKGTACSKASRQDFRFLMGNGGNIFGKIVWQQLSKILKANKISGLFATGSC